MGSDKSILDVITDISKSSKSQQLVLGSAAGLITGLISVRIGKIVAVTIGGGIILLQVAKENDLIKINWNKVDDKINKIADNVEEKITGQAPRLLDKMERYVDRNLDKMENTLKKQKGNVQKWYNGSNGKPIEYLFYISFIGGLCIGLAAAH